MRRRLEQKRSDAKAPRKAVEPERRNKQPVTTRFRATVVVALLVGVVAVSLLSARRKSRQWAIKYGSMDITPTSSVFQAGFASRTRTPKPEDGILFPLQASVLFLSRRSQLGFPIILLTFDLIGMGAERAGRVRREISEGFNVNIERVILSFSHTHSGPVIEGNLDALFLGISKSLEEIENVRLYSEQLETAITNLVQETAQTEWRFVSANYGVGHWKGAVNRRKNKERDFVDDSETTGPVDHSVPTLSLSSWWRREVVVFGYAAHPTVLTTSYAYSSDYPGSARAALELMNPRTKFMFLNGCAGDVNVYPRGNEESVIRHGQDLAKAVSDGMSGQSIHLDGPLLVGQRRFPLPYKRFSTQRMLRTRLARNDNKFEIAMLERLVSNSAKTLKEYDSFSISLVQIGTLSMVLLAGEPVVDYAFAIHKLLNSSRSHPVWVAGYTNDVCGYIPSRTVALEGGYEAGERSASLYGHPEPFSLSSQTLIEEQTQILTLMLNADSQTLK